MNILKRIEKEFDSFTPIGQLNVLLGFLVIIVSVLYGISFTDQIQNALIGALIGLNGAMSKKEEKKGLNPEA